MADRNTASDTIAGSLTGHPSSGRLISLYNICGVQFWGLDDEILSAHLAYDGSSFSAKFLRASHAGRHGQALGTVRRSGGGYYRIPQGSRSTTELQQPALLARTGAVQNEQEHRGGQRTTRGRALRPQECRRTCRPRASRAERGKQGRSKDGV